jgi:histidyl-tRNA synthetase
MSSLPIPPICIQVNNRKVLQGFYEGLGVDDVHGVLRAVDKLDKIGPEGVRELLAGQGVGDSAVDLILQLANIRTSTPAFADQVMALGVSNPQLDQGLEELSFVMDQVAHLPEGSVVADLHIARGLAYYTGTVFEGLMQGHEAMGSVCSGGRYDNLATAGATKYPGVGVSVGVSRILGALLGQGKLTPSRTSPTAVLIALHTHESRSEAWRIAGALRARGVNTEVFHKPVAYRKQMKYAERRGIPFLLFPATGPGEAHQIKDIRTGIQVDCDLGRWTPPPEDQQVNVEFK